MDPRATPAQTTKLKVAQGRPDNGEQGRAQGQERLQVRIKGKLRRFKASLSRSLPAGSSAIKLKAKVAGKKMPPGTYKIVAAAKNAAGASPRRSVKLTVVRR